MTTWQLFSEAGNNFRWEISVLPSETRPEESRGTLILRDDHPDPRLPSMADLLFQGSSKLMQTKAGGNDGLPMFRTGSGKSVAVKQSSLLKALSVLGEEDAARNGEVCATEDRHCFSNSHFRTGSGKTVSVSSAGLLIAKTLLGLEENNNHFNFQGLGNIRNLPTTDELNSFGNSSNLEIRAGLHKNRSLAATSVPRDLVRFPTELYSSESDPQKQTVPDLRLSVGSKSSPIPSPIKFQTAGGRSISVSSDALHRARCLLGDAELGNLPNEGTGDDSLFSIFKEKTFGEIPLNKENDSYAPCLQQNAHASKTFRSPMGLISSQKQSIASAEDNNSGSNSPKKVGSNSFIHEETFTTTSNIFSKQKSSKSEDSEPFVPVKHPLGKDSCSRMSPLARSLGRPLVDISNNIGHANSNQKHTPCEKKRFGRKSSISPFKRPRNSRFITPLTSTISLLPTGPAALKMSEGSCYKMKVSTRYPFEAERKTVKEFFRGPPCYQKLLEHVPDQVKFMNADSAEKYMFCDKSGSDVTGREAFHHMLSKSGASTLNASKEWVANHYKWIVWKLACYERCYPVEASGRYLTVSNVIEELKYRYEREVNHGHRSAVKRIVEGDASPASMMVLCISAIRSYPEPKLETRHPMPSHEDAKKISGSNWFENSNVGKVELTDGWYSLDALLDVPLSKQLLAGKLFVGQKLRVWGAGLSGWAGPISPLEGSTEVHLLCHINGTYRACWADRLGFCKGLGSPLAFRCIKGGGGMVPRTLVGVTRIYPVLYKERLNNGGSVVRSEKMEAKMVQLYNQRRSMIAEGVMSEFQKDIDCPHRKSEDSEEGAKILKILETAAEPEVLMAAMSSEQLTYFATYQAKQEAMRQSDMQKKIEKAIENAGLSGRDVTPFLRVRVVGLTSKYCHRKGCMRDGLITIWNPTGRQSELAEGQAYTVTGLKALNSDSDTIYLHARGSTTSWQPLSPLATECFEPFFTPRKSVSLSNLGEVPLAREFDIAAVVVYVGEVYTSGHQKRQWVFVTDGSISGPELHSEGSADCLLAVSFCLPDTDNDSSALINRNLEGSTVGFCNLVKRSRDKMNHLWVAEATENSTYLTSYDFPGCSHLKEAASCARKWAKISYLTIQKLRERVLIIIGGCDS
ncbi:protein BREAST CANCER SUSCEPTIBILITY 2 homolog B-like isoform X2 [Telopea speciosissima]|uniref:protein BREAST CANCER SUSCEPTIBILITY 2 homolog B-like isoform X2 n=1 Tax=Telopea speciosissima TaxID=54955 RepID=UPI001CC5F7FF|nr:protein BREAST CANCER SUSCEPTIBILITY 2 homolog B-like isoform X2 [Telopea speciosissima]